MNVSREEALEALRAVRQVEERARRAIGLAGGGPILMIWGVVWFIGFLGNQLLTVPHVGRLWAVVDLAGIVGTLWVVSRLHRRVIDPLGPRIGLFWLLLVGYGVIWVWIAQPMGGRQLGLLLSTIAMFGYVVLGLWIDTTFLWIGLGVTALALLGYLAVPDFFDLWMALLGGGALFASGVRIQRSWRQP